MSALTRKVLVGYLAIVSLLLFTWSSHGNDIISVAFLKIRDFVCGLSAPFYLLPIRFALIFLFSGILCIGGFARVSPAHLGTSFVRYQQIILAIVGILIGAFVPLERLLTFSISLRGAVFALALIVDLLAPRFLPFFVIPTAGIQEKITKICYLVILGAFLFTFLL